MSQDNHQVPEVCHRGSEQRLDALVQLEGIVSSTGDQAEDDDDVGEAVVDDTTQNTMNQCKYWKEIECCIDSIATSAREKLARQDWSEDEHKNEREEVECEDNGVKWIHSFMCTV